MIMEKGPQSQKNMKEKGKNENNHKGNDNTSKKAQNKNPPASSAAKKKAPKAKKKDKGKHKSAGVGSQIFAPDEIRNNKEASALISDLVKCYTCNSDLPKKELDILNKTLYEKTVTLFLHILNNCVEKIFNKLLGTDIFKEIFLKGRRNVNFVCHPIKYDKDALLRILVKDIRKFHFKPKNPMHVSVIPKSVPLFISFPQYVGPHSQVSGVVRFSER